MSLAAAVEHSVKRCAKVAIASGLAWSGRVRQARAAQRDELRVLMYHGVLPKVHGPAAYGELFVSTDQFAAHMRHVARHYHPMSMLEVADTLESSRPFPARAVAVTFDDGYRMTIDAMLPVLDECRVPATIFVPSEMIGEPHYLWFDAMRVLVRDAQRANRTFDLGDSVVINPVPALDQEGLFRRLNTAILALPSDSRARVRKSIARLATEMGVAGNYPEFALASWDGLRDAIKSGRLSVGSHARMHGDLTEMPSSEQVQDLHLSRLRIEQELGQSCTTLAYPYGRWNADSVEAARAAGYRTAVTVTAGPNRCGQDPFKLSRIMAGDKGHLSILKARLAGAFDVVDKRSAPVDP